MEQENGEPKVEYQADWDGVGQEVAPGEQSCADRFVQALLETLLSIIMEIKGRPDAAESFEDGTLLGHLDATVKALTMALEHLELSPPTRCVAQHVLKKGALPEDLASMK